ncbi:Solute carrier family 23 member 2 [Portunus trituberculatus]|uniref:Solute carrier family 23 member 2 n=1 Tax=Portunus trituberculatus TaxID=210409 RepID=A0A5B7G9H8_PORTR|nr:Solute carrier family 23 member 2 [Portunus trituberculatus]
MASGTIAIPILAASFLCLEEDDPARGTLVSTVLVHSGIVTLLQTTFGVRPELQSWRSGSRILPYTSKTVTAEMPHNGLAPVDILEEYMREALFSFRPLVAQTILFIVVPILGPISTPKPPKRIFGVTT